jgi:hypothetical protein
MSKSANYLLISLITFIGGYFFLRYAYLSTENIPFAQEIVLIILGTIATIAITAALLNKQSEVEIEKEQRVKLFDLKSTLYFELIEFIEKIIVKGTIDENDLIALEFLTHKISIIANPEVLQEYSNFIKIIKNTSQDAKITSLESDELSSGLAKLCGKIRYDLIAKDTTSTIDVEKMIKSNINSI